jgi:hypothetical protein
MPAHNFNDFLKNIYLFYLINILVNVGHVILLFM